MVCTQHSVPSMGHHRKGRLGTVWAAVVAALFLVVTPAQADRVELAGDILQVALPLTGLGLTYYHDDREGRGQALGAFAATMGATYALKLTVDEERPGGSSRTDSFPSGHTAAAFSGASFIQRRYGWALGAPAYALASFVGYSRVDSDNHYERDVFAGAAIAVAATYWLVEPHPALRDVAVTPLTDGEVTGLHLDARF
ncbi:MULTISPECIES: phosphatase PAP2 family protein [unclassified Halorhodospira]|uniref:phosphatase PAP2 family protein n=1 Tax=unclassified Halorhodospira TaxID=2626748 RepID=UPI001EE8E9FF|nr:MULTISPECIES: phosphatase PAP2 family protein [unclassified Halorhodospira]MCG5541630.1 phosphatase PAP2 family protein [Halorhodospira sp. M39old]MCG5546566.1 phosphatase PAP2 family protein [Halorhodospira sp. M38]